MMTREEAIAELERYAADYPRLRPVLSALRSPQEVSLPDSEGWWWEWVPGRDEWLMIHAEFGDDDAGDCVIGHWLGDTWGLLKPGHWAKALPPTSPPAEPVASGEEEAIHENKPCEKCRRCGNWHYVRQDCRVCPLKSEVELLKKQISAALAAIK